MDLICFPFRDLQGLTRKLRTPKTARTGPERAEPTETGRNQAVAESRIPGGSCRCDCGPTVAEAQSVRETSVKLLVKHIAASSNIHALVASSLWQHLTAPTQIVAYSRKPVIRESPANSESSLQLQLSLAVLCRWVIQVFFD